jgi:hypothetical protein
MTIQSNDLYIQPSSPQDQPTIIISRRKDSSLKGHRTLKLFNPIARTVEDLKVFNSKPFEFPLFKHRYAPIHIYDQRYPLYIKISELSQKLGISQTALRHALKVQPNAINEIIEAQSGLKPISLKDRTLQKVINLVNESKNTSVLKIAYQLQRYAPQAFEALVGEDGLLRLIQGKLNSRANEGLLQRVLDDDQFYQALKNSFPRDLMPESILKAVLENDQLYESLKSLRSRVRSEVFDQLLVDERFGSDKDLQNTLIAISTQWNDKIDSRPFYIKKIQEKDSRYGFLIDQKKTIYICYSPNPKGQNIIGKGTYKKVKEAIRLGQPLKENCRQFVNINIKAQDSTVFKEYSATVQESIDEDFKNEKEMLRQLKGLSNVLPPYLVSASVDTKQFGTKHVAVQFKMDGDGRQLYESINKVKSYQKLSVLAGVARGIANVHKKGIIHGDIKPANMLFEGKLKSSSFLIGYINDFGQVTRKGLVDKGGGTAAYKAPEIINFNKNNNKAVTNKIDSFAFGISMIQIIFDIDDPRIDNRFFVFSNQNRIDDFISSKQQEINRRTDLDEKEKKIFKDMLEVAKPLLRIDPKERLSCQEAAKRLEKILANVQ